MAGSTDAERYVAFFKETLVFFNTYEELQTLWREQQDNRVMLGVTPAQEREMARACAARRHDIEAKDDVIVEFVPRRPGR